MAREKATIVKSKRPHESCGGTQSVAEYSDGGWYCFKCNEHGKVEMAEEMTPKAPPIETSQVVAPLPLRAWRGVTESTFKRYGVTFSSRGGVTQLSYNYGQGASKVRTLAEKKFSFVGRAGKKLELYGQRHFQPGGKYVTITEGELDAMSLYQAFGQDYAVVSLVDGADAAVEDCQRNYQFLDSFENVVIAFDSDKPGQEAASKVAKLFVGKSRIVKLDEKYKDSNGYLEAGATTALTKAWWAAEPYRLEAVTNADTLWEEAKAPAVPPLFVFGQIELNDMTDGVRPGEVVVLTAGTGIGKSSYARELVDHILLTTTGFKIGMLMLEESPSTTIKRQIAVRLRKRIYKRDVVVTDEELEKGFKEVTKDGRLEIYSQLKVTSPDEIITTLTYMIKALGCKVLVLDHISIVVSGSDEDNERKVIDKFMTQLRALTEATGSAVIAIIHLTRQQGSSHEEGGRIMLSHLRGSGGVAQLSDIIIALERDSQGGGSMDTLVRVLKNRWIGDLGPACTIRYVPQYGVSVYVGGCDKAPPIDTAEPL